MNYVFEWIICFVKAIIAWHGDRPIFSGRGKIDAEEDMVDPLIITLEETELLNHDHQGNRAAHP